MKSSEDSGRKEDHAPKARKKERKRNKHAPKPGDKGFKTATQLRNARKRRAKKQKNASQKEKDPSQRFLANPKGAPIVQAARLFFQDHETEFEVTMGPTRGWRTVAKLAVRPSDDGNVSIGLFAPNSHTLIPVPECVAHHPSINSAVAVLEKVCRQVKVHAFDETTGSGHLRHVVISVERSTGKVQMTIVWNSRPYTETSSVVDDGKQVLDALCKALIAAGGKNSGRKRRRGRESKQQPGDEKSGSHSQDKFGLHSLWVHYNSNWKHSNSIFSIQSGSESWDHRYGPPCIMETLNLKECGSVSLRFPPNVFRQANLDAFANIVGKIRGRISTFTKAREVKDKNLALPEIVELYGGVGTIGLHIADLSSSLVSSDENPFNEVCFNESSLDLPACISQQVLYKSMDATSMVQSGALEQADVVIVDPPRKGLDETVLKSLCTESRPKLLVYVSCGFDAFQRDCAALLNSKWNLDHAEGHLLFPGSDAIETLAVFVAKELSKRSRILV